jgi:AraC-like DNA-binding protein
MLQKHLTRCTRRLSTIVASQTDRVETPMLFVPLPFVVSFSLIIMSVFLYCRGNEQRLNLPFFYLVIIAALQTLLAGLRWGYELHTISFFSPVLSATIPPLAYCGVAKLVRQDLQPKLQFAAHVLPAICIILLMVVWPEAIDGAVIIIFSGYAIAILLLMRAGEDSLDLTPFEQATSAYRAVIFAALSLLFYALLDAVVYLEFILALKQSALFFITIGNISTLIILSVAAAGIGKIPEPAKPGKFPVDIGINTADDGKTPQPFEYEKIINAVDTLLVSKRFYRNVDLNLDRLARKLGISTRQISMAINQSKARNVSQYINEFRVAEACDLLLKTDTPVTEIMLSVGFQTKSNFNREFRRITNMTPVQWRSVKSTKRKAVDTQQTLNEVPSTLS